MVAYSNLKGTRSPPARILPPSSPDVLALRRPASASWVLREAKQVAPTTRLAGRQSSKSRCAPPGSRPAPPALACNVPRFWGRIGGHEGETDLHRRSRRSHRRRRHRDDRDPGGAQVPRGGAAAASLVPVG